jgi:hypothetical protein
MSTRLFKNFEEADFNVAISNSTSALYLVPSTRTSASTNTFLTTYPVAFGSHRKNNGIKGCVALREPVAIKSMVFK